MYLSNGYLLGLEGKCPELNYTWYPVQQQMALQVVRDLRKKSSEDPSEVVWGKDTRLDRIFFLRKQYGFAFFCLQSLNRHDSANLKSGCSDYMGSHITSHTSHLTWTVVCQAPLSTEFSRQEYWSEQPFPSPGDLPDSRIKLRYPILQVDSLPSEPRWESPHATEGPIIGV